MSRLILRGGLLLPEGLRSGTLTIEAGRIVEISQASGSAELEAHFVAPGFIDLQVNGAFGVDVADGGDAVRTLCGHLPSTGVTAFLPTAISSFPAEYARVHEGFEAARDATGAVPLGLHLEGPLLGRAGAHRQEVLNAVEDGWLEPLLEHGSVRLMTLAPEHPHALDWIRRLRARNVAVSLGHTGCDWETFERAVDAGATMATHLFNAMSPFGHRAPGAAGGALSDDRVICGIIADGVHVHPAAMKIALRAKGPQRLALVTDAMPAAGKGPGQYRLGGQAVSVDATSARLPDGTLAGSILTMDEAVRNAVSMMGARVEDALHMAGEVPARALGLAGKGRLAVGADADVVLLDERLQIKATVVAGRVVFQR